MTQKHGRSKSMLRIDFVLVNLSVSWIHDSQGLLSPCYPTPPILVQILLGFSFHPALSCGAVVKWLSIRTRNTGVGFEFESYTCHKQNTLGEGKPPHDIHFPRKNTEPCLWFLLRSKSNMRRSFLPVLWLAAAALINFVTDFVIIAPSLVQHRSRDTPLLSVSS